MMINSLKRRHFYYEDNARIEALYIGLAGAGQDGEDFREFHETQWLILIEEQTKQGKVWNTTNVLRIIEAQKNAKDPSFI